MGTETVLRYPDNVRLRKGMVKLNNPLMGTETFFLKQFNRSFEFSLLN